MERYDPEENKWEVIGSMAVPRYYFGCCELQGVFSTFILKNKYSSATWKLFFISISKFTHNYKCS